MITKISKGHMTIFDYVAFGLKLDDNTASRFCARYKKTRGDRIKVRGTVSVVNTNVDHLTFPPNGPLVS